MSNRSSGQSAALSPTHKLLAGPVVPTMLRLAVPTTLVMVIQTLASVLETYFVSRLGTNALAGASIVFPVLMVMQMMSGGGFGAGVTSAIARALGAGRKADADALVFHAVVLGLVFGAVFTAAELLYGEVLYRALGASGESLSAALVYSQVIFAGAIVVWVVNLLAAALRGSGNVTVPMVVSVGSVFALVLLSPVLIFGWGPVPALGIAGAGLALIVFYLIAAVVMIAYLRSHRSAIRLQFSLNQLKWRLFKDVLQVGGLSAVGALQANLTVVMVTGAVGFFGAGAIAGYGVASRLDYLLLPLLFGLGTAVITMVGVNVGAGHVQRAKQVAWSGAWVAGGVSALISLVVFIWPNAWLGLFSSEPGVLDTGSLYLRVVGPSYAVYSFAMMLYFAGQGSGRVFWHFWSSTLRLVIVGVVGWIVVAQFDGSLTALFVTVAAGSLAFGAMNVVVVAHRSWGRPRKVVEAEPSGDILPAPALSIVPDEKR